MKDVVLPARKDVSYIISHQYTQPIYKYTPLELIREDIMVAHIPGKGVTISRNNAIKLCNADIALFSDDDVRYKNEYFDTIFQKFKADEQLVVGLFKIKTIGSDKPFKTYKNREQIVDKIDFSVGTIEMAFRVKPIQSEEVFFDTRFGAGNSFLIGSDENIFVHDCISHGLKTVFFPEVVVEHPEETTVKGIKKYDNRIARVTGGYDARVNGWVALLKTLPGTVKILPDLLRHKKNPLVYFYERMRGTVYILFTNVFKPNNSRIS